MDLERRDRIEIEAGSAAWPVVFSTSGEYLFSGGNEGVQVWRVRDGKQVAKMGTDRAFGLAASKDGRWIAAGTRKGDVLVWDTTTYEQVWKHNEDDASLTAVDFSPDSSRLLSASENKTASVWDIATRQRVLSLRHEDEVRAARYSPQGDRIATTTRNSVHVYDASDGHSLADIEVPRIAYLNTRFLWSNDHIFVVSGRKIVQIDVSRGSPDRERHGSASGANVCIAVLKHKEFIAYTAAVHTVSFWNLAMGTQFGVIEHTEAVYSIAISPDDQLIAVGGGNGKIVIENISHIVASAGERGQDEKPSATSGDRNHPSASTLEVDESGAAQPGQSNNEEGGNDLLNAELPSSTPAQPQFDLEEPPSPDGSVHAPGADLPVPGRSCDTPQEQPVPSSSKAHPGETRDAVKASQHSSRFTRWPRMRTKKSRENPTSDEPHPLSEGSHPSGSTYPLSRPQPPARVARGPSTYALAQREKRMMVRAIRPRGIKSPGKLPAKPVVPAPPNKDAPKDASNGGQGSSSEQRETNTEAPSQTGNNGTTARRPVPVSRPINGARPSTVEGVHIQHQPGAPTAFLAIPLPAWILCCRSDTLDGIH